MKLPFTPKRAYRLLKNQLGSVRRVYLNADLVRRRDDFGTDREVVLLLHGFFQTRNIWEVMEDRLRYDGYTVMSFNLTGPLWRFNTEPVDRTAKVVAEKIEALAARHQFSGLHIIGHSKGGLIARRYVQKYGGDTRVRSVITLGTPHQGTPTALVAMPVFGIGTSVRDLLPRSQLIRELRSRRSPPNVPMTSVYSRQDVLCPWWCAVLHPRQGERHLTNVEVPGVGHSALTWHPGVYRVVRSRLAAASARQRDSSPRQKEGTTAAR